MPSRALGGHPRKSFIGRQEPFNQTQIKTQISLQLSVKLPIRDHWSMQIIIRKHSLRFGQIKPLINVIIPLEVDTSINKNAHLSFTSVKALQYTRELITLTNRKKKRNERCTQMLMNTSNFFSSTRKPNHTRTS